MRVLIVRLTKAELDRFADRFATTNGSAAALVGILERMPGFFSLRKRAEGRRILLVPNRQRGEKRMEEGEL